MPRPVRFVLLCVFAASCGSVSPADPTDGPPGAGGAAGGGVDGGATGAAGTGDAGATGAAGTGGQGGMAGSGIAGAGGAAGASSGGAGGYPTINVDTTFSHGPIQVTACHPQVNGCTPAICLWLATPGPSPGWQCPSASSCPPNNQTTQLVGTLARSTISAWDQSTQDASITRDRCLNDTTVNPSCVAACP